MKKSHKWLIFIPLVLAVGGFLLLNQNRQGSQQTPRVETPQAVQTISVPSVALVPRAVVYGNVQPARVWEAVAEVNGRIVALHPNLKKGALIQQDEEVARIDPSDYQLSLRQIEADIQAAKAQLQELDTKEKNTRTSLAIEQEALQLAEADLDRLRKLRREGSIPQATLEQTQRQTLSQRQSVQNLNNSLNLIPSQRAVLEAQLARLEVQRESAGLNLSRTVLTMPFSGRIAQVNVERAQFVRQGEVLAVADSIDVAEITVQISVSQLRPLIPQGVATDAELIINQVPRLLDLDAMIRLPGTGIDVKWAGRVVRASEAVDPRTRSLGLVIAVDEPYRQAQPGVRPPLIKGMFTEVELRGQTRPDTLVIPLVALHEEQIVYTVDEQQRLQLRSITLGSQHGDFVVVTEGLQAGEQIIVSDLPAAITGMLLEPVPDTALRQRLITSAQGGSLNP